MNRDLWDSSQHSHANIHEAIYNNFLDVASQAYDKMHVCWLRTDEWDPSCSLGAVLGYPDVQSTVSGGDLGRSLVMASPKHMVFGSDPNMFNLPLDKSSRFIFHDMVPTRFEEMRRRGLVVEWVVRGPDGNVPIEDAAYFVRNEMIKPEFSCDVEKLACSFPQTQTYVAPWGTSLTPVSKHVLEW